MFTRRNAVLEVVPGLITAQGTLGQERDRTRCAQKLPCILGDTEAPSGWRQRTEVSQDGARLLELHKHKTKQGKNRCRQV